MRRRRAITLSGVTATAALVGFLASPSTLAQQTPAAPAARPPSDAPPTKLEFASDAGLILSPIKPDGTAAFEEVMARVRDALARSADPVRKQQAAGWKIYRAHEAYQNTTLYVSVMDPAVKGADYSVYRLLVESLGEAPARELFEKFRDAHVGGQHVLSLTPVAKPAS
jgi:hypothetical protein